jgi:hypothetical protein
MARLWRDIRRGEGSPTRDARVREHHRAMEDALPDNSLKVAPADEQPEPYGPCTGCGRDLWWTGEEPSMDGGGWICGECDAARGFDALDL